MTPGSRKRLAFAVGLLVVLVFVSCGSGEDVTGREQSLEEMITASVGETDPESCLKFSTLHFHESTSGLEGEAAIAACEEAALDPLVEQPTKIDVSRIDIDDDSATALLAVTGSAFDGQKMRYAFVEREGRWKFNEFLGFVDLDSAHLVLELGRDGMRKAESRQEAENVACWLGRMEQMSDKVLEDLLFGDGTTASSDCIAASNAV